MKTRMFYTLFLIGMMFLPAAVSAQLISIKTIPVATGDQFLVHPAQNLGMGGVSIAVDDTLLDPFINPAKGARLTGMYLFSAPVYSSVSEHFGALKTLPMGMMFRSGAWFGGLSLAIQQMDASAPDSPNIFRVASPFFQSRLLSEKAANNTYISGLIGKKITGSNFSVAGSGFWSGLDAMDGVDLLYPRSLSIEQFGSTADFRAGLLGDWEDGRSFEALVLHNRSSMTHDVTYADWINDPFLIQVSSWVPRVERNLDRTNTWGFHTGYVQPVLQDRVRLGGILTVNRKSHPKLPNYELMNVPRDPGHSWAYNVGLGLSRTHGNATFGMDLIMEPVRTRTWAEAAGPVTATNGQIIPAGGRTVDNNFRFLNSILRLGLRGEETRYGVQVGVQVRSIRYTLDQEDHITASRRKQKESWGEWTLSAGAALKFADFQLRYHGSLTTGTGRPGVAWSWFQPRSGGVFAASGDFIPAPGGPLTLEDTNVMTHQLTISIPIRLH